MAGKKGHSGGWRPGAGRKPNELHDEQQALLREGWPRENRLAAIRRLGSIAEGDDPELAIRAAELLLNRTFGKPTERKELSGPEGGPIQLTPVDYRAGLDALAPEAE